MAPCAPSRYRPPERSVPSRVGAAAALTTGWRESERCSPGEIARGLLTLGARIVPNSLTMAILVDVDAGSAHMRHCIGAARSRGVRGAVIGSRLALPRPQDRAARQRGLRAGATPSSSAGPPHAAPWTCRSRAIHTAARWNHQTGPRQCVDRYACRCRYELEPLTWR